MISQINDEGMTPDEHLYTFQKSNLKSLDFGGEPETNGHKPENNEPVKITNLKDLLRLFRVNLVIHTLHYSLIKSLETRQHLSALRLEVYD